MIVILAAIDKRNAPPSAGFLSLVLFIVPFGIGAALGMEAGEYLSSLP